MSTINHDTNRELQQDARAWAKFTDTPYTAALRQMQHPLAQGFLGERISARHLITTITTHPMLSNESKSRSFLSHGGIDSNPEWHFNHQNDYVRLALITDMLRMFTPIPEGQLSEVNSYSLKHTTEEFLIEPCTYVSNGQVIWAAAALGLVMDSEPGFSPNILIGISEREHDYVKRLHRTKRNAPKADHFQPPGYNYFHKALELYKVEEEPQGSWSGAKPTFITTPFHDWATKKARGNSPVREAAEMYILDVFDSDCNIMNSGHEYLSYIEDEKYIFDGNFHDSVCELSAIWERVKHRYLPSNAQL